MYIKVVGYYHHDNIGDDQYILTMKMLFRENLQFIDCDQLTDIHDNDTVILGGGAVLNDYFVKKLMKVINDTHILIGLSVDLPYTEMLISGKLNRFDHIYLRNKQDLKLFQTFYDPSKVSYLADLSCLLSKIPKKLQHHHHHRKKIGLIVFENKIFPKESVINMMIDLQLLYDIILISFNKTEDSVYYRQIEQYANITKPFSSVLDTYKYISEMDIVISMRYHGCLFSLHNNIPFININNTRKIACLLKDLNWPYSSTDYKTVLSYIPHIPLPSYTYTIDIPAFRTSFFSIKHVGHNSINDVLTLQTTIDDMKTKYSADIITKYISHKITGSINSKYNYGLSNKIMSPSFDFMKSIHWLIDDYYSEYTYIPRFAEGGVDIFFKDQDDKSGVHRSGWKFVYDNIVKYMPLSDTGVLLDLYVDETFHWSFEIYKLLKVIPYVKPWFGFIHHTFDESFSDYNCEQLFKNSLFIESLATCRGLIVLSEYLQVQMINKLTLMFINVPVYVIYHPTELNVKKFTMTSFNKNRDRKIINIGTWLRDIYSFYELKLDLVDYHCLNIKKSMNLTKAALIGKNYSSYYPADNIVSTFEHLEQQLLEHHGHISHHHCHISHHRSKNNWYKKFFENFEALINSVEKIHFTTPYNYDELLSKNIVYTKVIDCSAINVLVECIARFTPILINKHPAVVELLGLNYPMYIEDITSDKLMLHKIVDTHNYLRGINQVELDISTFLEKLKIIIK
jgi:polysaccharide pyruvyl transferase WcaK-like protein